jgi:hypothetical protein
MASYYILAMQDEIDPPRERLRRAKAANYARRRLGQSVRVNTLRSWPIPYRQIGRDAVYELADLDRFIDARLAAAPQRRAPSRERQETALRGWPSLNLTGLASTISAASRWSPISATTKRISGTFDPAVSFWCGPRSPRRRPNDHQRCRAAAGARQQTGGRVRDPGSRDGIHRWRRVLAEKVETIMTIRGLSRPDAVAKRSSSF